MRHWIKLYTEILRDPKMGRLTDRQYRTCINLFVVAGIIDEDGKLPPTDDLAWHLRVDATELTEDLEALARVHIVKCLDGEWLVCKWAERQAKAPSDEPEQVRQRVADHRARKRNETVTTLHENVTHLETETETDTDTDTEEDTETETEPDGTPEPPPPFVPSEALIEYAKTRPLSRLEDKDRETVGELIDTYGDATVKEAITWCWEHKKTSLLSLAYVRATLAGWQADGKPGERVAAPGRNGNTPAADTGYSVPAGYEDLVADTSPPAVSAQSPPSEGEKVWAMALNSLRAMFPPGTGGYEHFKNSKAVGYTDDVLTVVVRDAGAQNMIEQRLMKQVNKALYQASGKSVTIRFEAAL